MGRRLIAQVSSLLHHFSIRRGIQVLRQQNFQPDCLKRRAQGGDESDTREVASNSFTTRIKRIPIGQVLLWTNHRVMDWLRQVDLAEYAPNLRGAGVHGGSFRPIFYSFRS